LFFARQSGSWISMAAGLPIGLGLIWLCSDGASNRPIAEKIGVTHTTVNRARGRLEQNGPVEKRVGRDGKTRKMLRRRQMSRRRRRKSRPGDHRAARSATAVDDGRFRGISNTLKWAGPPLNQDKRRPLIARYA
jgi:hypothetical protein